MPTTHRSPAAFVLLLMAAAATWISFFPRRRRPAARTGPCCRWELHRARQGCPAGLQARHISDDPDNYLESWQPGQLDCCRWDGITCSNTTGHVIQLDLGFTHSLAGQISPSLLSLAHLEYLDLNSTALTGHHGGVPEFLGSLKNLRHLALSDMGFTGRVPPQLGNLSKLEYLDLSNSRLDIMYSTDISWLSRLPLLVYLDMSYTNLSSIAADWPIVVNMLPSLEYLGLTDCSLSSANRSLTHLNLANLQFLDLSYNHFDHPIASAWFWNVTSVTDLLLLETSMYGPFPNALGNMTSLQRLSFGCYLHLLYPATTTCNQATMEVDLRNLCDLESLELGGGHSSGNITKFLEKLPRCPSNRLQHLSLRSNNMVGSIPLSIGNFSYLELLDLSNNHLTGPIPLEITSCTKLEYLTLSSNLLTGHVPSKIGMLSSLTALDLSNNKLDGVITEEHLVTLKSLQNMDLSNNSLSGPLPSVYGAPGLIKLTLSFNYFSGHIPESIFCNLRNLLFLDLSDNFLEGQLPRCSHQPSLVFLQLSKNRFCGKFPSALQNYSSLAFMDLSTNNFYGTLPMWIGDLVYLRFLQLSHNLFTGTIPVHITNLMRLRQLSLAGNGMSGVIPWSFSNLTAMTQKHPKRPEFDMSMLRGAMIGKFSEVWAVVMKHQELKYGSTIFDVVGIDLSLNQLVGGIPDGVTSLNGLLSLNLSWNHLSGNIPANIGSMKSIESLDFSRNSLSGEIPSSFSNLTYLSSLDLSYNNLKGRIPPGGQLDTLYMENPSIYTGNTGLCGPPLEMNCSGDNAPEHVNQHLRGKVSEPVLFFYFGFGSGFLVGLWIVFCALLFKKAWRVAYFRLFEKLYDNAYVFVVLTWGKMNAKSTS